jgi:formylglycine-generating enzyme required for sulfatase activity
VLDGLDQAPKSKLKALLDDRDGLRPFSWVVAGREEGFKQLHTLWRYEEVPVLDMQLFEREHVQKFLAAGGVDERTEYAHFALDEFEEKDEGHRTYNTPLMLTFLTQLAREAGPGEPPDSELELFEAYIRKMAERGRRQRLGSGREVLSEPEVIRIWEGIAYEALAWCPEHPAVIAREEDLSEEGLRPLARPHITENTARMLAEMVGTDAFAGKDGTPGWVDAFLDGLLADCGALEQETPGRGRRGRRAAERNAWRSNLLYTAMAVRDIRYDRSLAAGRSGEADESGYRPHALLEEGWAEQRDPTGRHQEGFTRPFADRLDALKDDWPAALGSPDEWIALPHGPSVIGSWDWEDAQPIRKLRFPLKPEDELLLMCRHPVTNAEYRQFVGESGYDGSGSEKHLRHMRDEGCADFRGDAQPVLFVSWEDARQYCEWLEAKVDFTVRLPRELEWEYACRAGTTAAYCFGNDESRLEDYGWFYRNSGSEVLPEGTGWDVGKVLGDWRCMSRPVGQKRSNAWELHDMHGNVWEWCREWYDADAYKLSPGEEPAEGSSRVLRGGSWRCNPEYCRSACRNLNHPFYRFNEVGFRVLLLVRE